MRAHIPIDPSLAGSPRKAEADAEAAAAAAAATVVPNTTRRRRRMLHPLGSLRSSSNNDVAAVAVDADADADADADRAPDANAVETVEDELASAPADAGAASATPAACVRPRCTVRSCRVRGGADHSHIEEIIRVAVRTLCCTVQFSKIC